jgi:peptidoglycan/xylan/chitin deacetylase (PgdA/CDA1 family)
MKDPTLHMAAHLFKVAKRIAKPIIGRPIFGRSILLYHRVVKADFDPWNLAVSPGEFERQLVGLRSKTVLPLPEFVRLHKRKQLPRNAVAITFDDGYACNALVAAPMLESFSYPATFFVVSDPIGRGEEFWWDQLEFIFNAREFDYGMAADLLGNYSINEHRRTKAQDRTSVAAFLSLWQLARRLSTEDRRLYLDDLRFRMGLEKPTRSTHRPMTEAELRALAANPLFEIGGHTATHPSLPMLNPTEQEHEIVFGSRILEAKLGKPIRSFSYPFGDWGQHTRDIVMAAGFDCALTGAHRQVRSNDNPFELPRRQVVNRNAVTF